MTRLALAATAAIFAGLGNAYAQVTSKTFPLAVEEKFLACFAASSSHPPIATVHVQRSSERDKLILSVDGLKPHLSFNVFTVQRSNLNSDGTLDPAFTNFGLAWYQSDLVSDASGHATTTLFSIFIDQIFGFDPDATLAPTNTFHIGFWFDSPNKAVPCGFDSAAPTPFNGQHKAGPAAMISVPNAKSDLGPLCLNPKAASPSGCAN